LRPRSLDRFETFLNKEALSEIKDRARLISQHLAGRAVWNINSTATGGGVAEMLASCSPIRGQLASMHAGA
jgi:trehalose synthase